MLAEGWSLIDPESELQLIPMADGGEGTLQSLVDATDGELRAATVRGPLGTGVEAHWGVLGDGQTAMIESAQACGLVLVPESQRNPMQTTSWGVGELIRIALDQGVRRFVVGLGGSATVDGGAGLLMALGAALLDRSGHPIEPTGGGLQQLSTVDLSSFDSRITESHFTVAIDVDNPLLGPKGAAAVYGPQKGAIELQVVGLEKGLGNLARFIKEPEQLGAGAAGGMGAAFASFLGASLRPGVDVVAEEIALADQLDGADLVITGEGRIDDQTIFGKTPVGVARIAGERPVIAVAGELGDGWEAVLECGIDACLSIQPGPMSLEESVDQTCENLIRCGAQIAQLVQIGRSL